MGDVIPLSPRSPDGDGDDDRPTPVVFEIGGQHFEIVLTDDEVARLARDLET